MMTGILAARKVCFPKGLISIGEITRIHPTFSIFNLHTAEAKL